MKTCFKNLILALVIVLAGAAAAPAQIIYSYQVYWNCQWIWFGEWKHEYITTTEGSDPSWWDHPTQSGSQCVYLATCIENWCW